MRPLRPTSTRSVGTSLRDWGRDRHGGVAVTVAVMTAVLVGVLAIAIDLGRAYNLSTELDNAADAYALAGATQLDQSPGSCVRAMQAAINANLKNQETFASNPSGANVFIDTGLDPFNNSNIRFMERITKDANGNIVGDYIDVLYGTIAECDENAQHIEVLID
ncbi:MAG TPA: pilus assembly protein TadG-related protein, partial [Kiloniellales bacterium]